LNKAASSVFDAMLMSASQQLETTLTEENYAKALDDTYAQLEAVMPEKAALVAETKAQLDKLSEFKKGINSYTDGVAKAKDGSEKLSDGIKELQSKAKNLTDEYFTVNIPNLTSYLDAEDNPRIGAAADDVLINKVCAIFGGVVLLILFSYVISVFVVHNIDREEPGYRCTLFAWLCKKRTAKALPDTSGNYNFFGRCSRNSFGDFDNIMSV
jgi:putative ABC transport system permease protein